MGGLARVCKYYGRLRARGPDGKSVMWVWDYVADKAVHESEMPEGSERLKASERARWMAVRAALDLQKSSDTK